MGEESWDAFPRPAFQEFSSKPRGQDRFTASNDGVERWSASGSPQALGGCRRWWCAVDNKSDVVEERDHDLRFRG